MKPAQARKLISNLMEWTDSQATQEFQWLDLMTRYKFDHYQGYGPGRRFYVSLLRWLSQFSPVDRPVAYELLRDRLIFVSQREMQHLVGLAGPAIEREMRRHVATLMAVPVYLVDERADVQRRLRLLQARTLYVGVSDGARIDAFRRLNEGVISNEQVVPMAEISPAKWKSLHKNMRKRLDAKHMQDEEAIFEWVCLIDDFTGSGFSSIRLESDGSWDGKVGKFVKDNEDRAQHKLIKGARIQVHHYLASKDARDTITQRCLAIREQYAELSFCATFGHVLPKEIQIQPSDDTALKDLLERHYDPEVESTHTRGPVRFGYQECGLPLVLDHNTPNNSIGLIWARSPLRDKADLSKRDVPVMSPLFPRRQRHLDDK